MYEQMRGVFIMENEKLVRQRAIIVPMSSAIPLHRIIVTISAHRHKACRRKN